jgi:hypothetical protein
MKNTWGKLMLWSPRVLGIMVALFLALFALDVFQPGKSFMEVLPAFLIHIRWSLVLLVVVAVAWKWEWVGGLVFVSLAAYYAARMPRHLDWIAIIAGPLVIVGLLFLLSWRHHAELHARS